MTWLIITSSTEKNLIDFEHIFIPLQSIFLIAETTSNKDATLTEIYKIAADARILTKHFGKWTPKTGLSAVKEDLYNRRKNFQKHTFKFVLYDAGEYTDLK